MDSIDDARRAMALVVGAYWSGVARTDDVVSAARCHLGDESPPSLLELASTDPTATGGLLPGLLGLVLEDFDVFLIRGMTPVPETFALAYREPTFRQEGELDRQRFVAWVAAAFEEPMSGGYVQALADLDQVYLSRYVQSWGEPDEVESMLDSVVDDYVEHLESDVNSYLSALATSETAFPAPYQEAALSVPGLGEWSPALADGISTIIQAILRSV